jgi:hypothetical protein
MDSFPAQVKNIGGSILCDFDAWPKRMV